MSFANPVSDIIVQSGTDTDLTGLVGVTGVTVTSPGSALEIYDLGDNIKLQIDGTLTINGTDTGANEMLVVRNSAAAHAFPLVYVASGGTLTVGHVSSQTTPTTNFSSERFWPSIVEAESQDFDDGQGLNAPISGAVCPFLGVHALGTFNWYGCLNFTTGLFFDGSGRTGADDADVLIDGGVADCRRTTERGTGLVGDNFLYNYSTDFDCLDWTVLSQDADDRGVSVLLVAPPINFKNFVPVFTEEGAGVSISAAAGLAMTIENYNGVIGRSANRDWRSSGPGGNTHVIQFHNGSKGTALNIEEEAGPHASVLFKQAVRGTLLTSAGANRTDAVMATEDKDNVVTQDNTIVAGAWDLGLIQMASMVPPLAFTFANPSNTNDDLWSFYAYSYLGIDKNRLNVLLRKNDGLDIEFIAADDLGITETSISTVQGYLDVKNLDRFYDVAKEHKIGNVADPNITIPLAAAAGTIIDLGAVNLIVDGDVASHFAFATNTITLKPTNVADISRIGATEVIVDPIADQVTVTFPGGIADDDIAYIIIGHAESEDNAWNTPSGWTVITAEQQTAGTPDSTPGLTIFRRVLSSDSGTVVVTNAGTNTSGIVGQMVVFRDADTTTPEDATTTLASGASGDPDPASITTVNTGSRILAIALGDAEQILTSVPTNYTAINDTLVVVGGSEGDETVEPTFIDATEFGTGGAANNYTINTPTNIEDDLLIWFTVNSDSSDPADFNTPGGWSEDSQLGNLQTGGSAPSAPGMSVFYKFSNGSEPSTFNITTNPTASNGLCGQMLCFRGVDMTTPFDVTTTTATGDGSNADSPTIGSGSSTDSYGVVICRWHDSTTDVGSSVPSGYTDNGNGNVTGSGGGNGCTMQTAYKTTNVNPAAAEDPAAWTTSAEQWGAATLALRPGTGRSLDGCFLATADRLTGVAAAQDPGVFDFSESEEWATATIAVRRNQSGTTFFNLDAGTKFAGVKTTGAITIRDGATINGITLEGVTLDVDDVVNITDMTFTGDMHINTAGTYNFSNVTVTGDILNDDGTGNVLINASNGSSLSTTEPGTGNGQVDIVNTVTAAVTTKSSSDGSNIQNARVLLEADTGGDLPVAETVTITASGTTATVTHTAHAIPTGQKVVIRNANESDYNGVFVITVTGVNDYTYTMGGSPASPATGTIDATAAIIEGLTNASGLVQNTAFNYTTDQPVTGHARKSTSSPLFKTTNITGTITSTGFASTVFMVSDE